MNVFHYFQQIRLRYKVGGSYINYTLIEVKDFIWNNEVSIIRYYLLKIWYKKKWKKIRLLINM